jgi:hypothetical protein
MINEKRKFIPKKIRGRKICDQKANSVADIAAVLGHLEAQEAAEEGKKGGIGLKGEGTGEKVEVLWNDLNDAEFAETWSENVEHGVWRHHKNTVDLEIASEGEKEGLSSPAIEPESGERLVL